MKIDEYSLSNWRDLLDKDWAYLSEDVETGNIERIIEKLLVAVEKATRERDIEVVEKMVKELCDNGKWIDEDGICIKCDGLCMPDKQAIISALNNQE